MTTQSTAWARTRLIELGRRLGALPAEIEGAQNEVDNRKRLLADREREVKDRELELRITSDMDESLKNDRQRDAAHKKACQADVQLGELRTAHRTEDASIKAAEATLDRMKREFRAAEMQVQIITDGILVLEAMRPHIQATWAADDKQPREESA